MATSDNFFVLEVAAKKKSAHKGAQTTNNKQGKWTKRIGEEAKRVLSKLGLPRRHGCYQERL